jgi:hypothetical protein
VWRVGFVQNGTVNPENTGNCTCSKAIILVVWNTDRIIQKIGVIYQ